MSDTKEQHLELDGENIVTPDGGLYCLPTYVRWQAGADDITLDGIFDIEFLRAMLAHVDQETAKIAAEQEGEG